MPTRWKDGVRCRRKKVEGKSFGVVRMEEWRKNGRVKKNKGRWKWKKKEGSNSSRLVLRKENIN